jgi:hypothetical protein
MVPVTQTRVGDRGNCFAACLASILEEPLPEFGLTSDPDYDTNVDAWLAARGLRYTQVPSDVKPMGWTTIEGISPRGGMHAVVGLNGKIVWDPHPKELNDGQGLVSVERYGLLLPLGARDALQPIPELGEYPLAMPRRTKDAVALSPDKDGDRMLKYTARDAKPRWVECPHCGLKAYADEDGRITSHHDLRKQNPTWCAGIGKKALAKDALRIDVHGGVHRSHDAKLRGQFKKWAQGKDRVRLHRALDAVMDAVGCECEAGACTHSPGGGCKMPTIGKYDVAGLQNQRLCAQCLKVAQKYARSIGESVRPLV